MSKKIFILIFFDGSFYVYLTFGFGGASEDFAVSGSEAIMNAITTFYCFEDNEIISVGKKNVIGGSDWDFWEY